MLRRSNFLRNSLFTPSSILFSNNKSSSSSSSLFPFNSSVSSSKRDEDIHWYVKVWKDRAIDGGSSRLKRLSSSSNENEKKSSNNNLSSDTIARHLRIHLSQLQHELDLTHAIPDATSASLIEIYHALAEDRDAQIQFILDLVSFAPIHKESLSKQISKLQEYSNQLQEQQQESDIFDSVLLDHKILYCYCFTPILTCSTRTNRGGTINRAHFTSSPKFTFLPLQS